MLSQPLVFVDIETTGLDAIRGRVIEVAAIRVENGADVQEFTSLLDPGMDLPWHITELTGITDDDVCGAATFAQVAAELRAVLDGAVFVAHNVRFDYSFLAQEFRRLGQTFTPQQLCTVKLSRALYPQQKSHKLENLIHRHSLTYSSRHRAYDDAAAIWQFMQHVHQNFSPDQIHTALARSLTV